MADDASNGSPTPRKKGGGVLLYDHDKIITSNKPQVSDHPTLGDFDDKDGSSGLSMMNKVYNPKTDHFTTEKKKGKEPELSDNTNEHIEGLSASLDSTSSLTHAAAAAAGRPVSSLTSSTNSYEGPRQSREHSISTAPTDEDDDQMQLLLRDLEKTSLGSTVLHDNVGRTHDYSRFAAYEERGPPQGLGIFDFQQDIFPPGKTERSGVGNFTSAYQHPWNSNNASNGGLMHGSVPKYGASSMPIPQLPFNNPGVIGKPSSATSYRYSNAGNHNHHFQSAPYTQPLPQGQFPRANKSGWKGKRPAWGYNNGLGYDSRSSFGSNYGYESTSSSRAMTPAQPFGSLSSSAASSNVSLPGMGHLLYTPASSTTLSPMAAEFNAVPGTGFGPSPWNERNPREMVPQNYIPAHEPLNYRRLLDRNMTTDWPLIVDRIVIGNDQQASLFLQQKIKSGSPEQKQAIISIIIDRGVPLMINRFGNFLIQRCMEHGTPADVHAIAQAICGHTVNLSMDAFGCHVVQKAFDYAPEKQKKIMIHELLTRVKDTIIHRYACHVWQKLFELRWEGSRPEIMKFVNAELKGMWHDVALGETGSLVVQNIFENCTEEEKRPCIDEVLSSISVIATGQFGNWCIQHICEHGSIPDQAIAINHILMFATSYSTDQFASKVVEKCLKVCGNEFLDRYLERVCAYRHDVPRMDLIDIAGDQYGNYLIQHILTHADPTRREIVASHVRKHMVSLRGSKYGSRVAMLCTSGGYGRALPAPDRASGGGPSSRDDYGRSTGPWGLPRPSSGPAYRY
ncbi:hypothetical protein CAC42_3754 [Sphaceloma murrayae]|uniref:PUM-HD domain-containing protein n=1 Tax=Sphaceloma murrayae TaxID=2082308 RepID=A0A2K1QH33_9PEZI|nr:hypothetical protein CAC42_3754 [Sphaceloma murrayae]